MSKRRNTSILNVKNHKDWISSWYTCKQEYYTILKEDIIIFLYLRSKLYFFLVSCILNIKILRIDRNIIINIHSKLIDFQIRKILINFLDNLSKFFKQTIYFYLSKNLNYATSLNASNLALKIATLIEKKVKFRSKLVKILLKKLKKECKGLYVECTGRINNVDMARNDKMSLGSIPFKSLKYSINYGFAIANTIKGLQSIKVWICNN